jgi:hypothetical protein
MSKRFRRRKPHAGAIPATLHGVVLNVLILVAISGARRRVALMPSYTNAGMICESHGRIAGAAGRQS